METSVVYYQVDNAGAFWKAIVERFKSHLSANGVPYFKGDTDRGTESEFIRFCADRNLKLIRKAILEYDGKGPLEHPFYYLSVRDTREYEQEFIQLACDGGGKGMCWSGARQVRKVTVTSQIAKAVTQGDIAVKNYPISPRVYLISRRLKELLEPLQYSGYTLLPCLEPNRTYSDQESAFESSSEQLEAEAKYFQLVIKSKTKGPPNLGNLRAVSYCPRCGAASVIDGDKEREFRSMNLTNTDFQFYDTVISEDRGIVRLVGEIPIVSAKALQFFLANKIKGLKAYSTDPPIKFAIVKAEPDGALAGDQL